MPRVDVLNFVFDQARITEYFLKLTFTNLKKVGENIFVVYQQDRGLVSTSRIPLLAREWKLVLSMHGSKDATATVSCKAAPKDVKKMVVISPEDVANFLSTQHLCTKTRSAANPLRITLVTCYAAFGAMHSFAARLQRALHARGIFSRISAYEDIVHIRTDGQIISSITEKWRFSIDLLGFQTAHKVNELWVELRQAICTDDFSRITSSLFMNLYSTSRIAKELFHLVQGKEPLRGLPHLLSLCPSLLPAILDKGASSCPLLLRTILQENPEVIHHVNPHAHFASGTP